jgi:hypothetical protein
MGMLSYISQSLLFQSSANTWARLLRIYQLWCLIAVVGLANTLVVNNLAGHGGIKQILTTFSAMSQLLWICHKVQGVL